MVGRSFVCLLARLLACLIVLVVLAVAVVVFVVLLHVEALAGFVAAITVVDVLL